MEPENQGINAEMTGNMPASTAGYDYPALAELYPEDLLKLFQESVDAAAPRSVTPYWSDISSSLQNTWHPPAERQPGHTPGVPGLHPADPGRRETAVSTTLQRPPADVSAKPAASDRSKAENRLGLKLVAPAVVMMLLVTAWPMGQALYLSLFRYRLTAPDDREFIGIDNYVTVLTDSLFWQDTWNTVLIMVVTVAVELVIGFAFAMVMHRIIFARGLMRTSILIPYGIITVVSAFAWQFAFSLNNGFVNAWFHWLPWIAEDTNWFGDHWHAMFAIMVSEIWKTTPFMALLLLAGLSQVSEDMLEAAQVDGATWWQRLWKVILPNMRAAIMVAVLFRALDAYRIFDNIYIMTRGRPGHRVDLVPHLPAGDRADAARARVGTLGGAVHVGAAAGVADRQAVQGGPGVCEG